MITVSIVSHGHNRLITSLLAELVEISEIASIVLTMNIDEALPDVPQSLTKKVIFIKNTKPKGFGENHNAAFEYCHTPYYCVLNPDISLLHNPFPTLIKALEIHNAAMSAPKIVNSLGHEEDSVRYFPTPWRLAKRVFLKKHHEYHTTDTPEIFFPNWIAGMFMLFNAVAFQKLKGFDERYFLYYEDVDICVRIWKNSMRLLLDKQAVVVHDARRTSHRNFKFLRWHLGSMKRFFMQHLFNLPNPDPKTGQVK